MATNDNAQPLLVAGKLPKTCYPDLDEFVQDLSKVLALPLDAVAVIKGAQGETGPRGPAGAPGSVGPVGPSGINKDKLQYSIPLNAKYVEFPVFADWEMAIYNIRYNGLALNTNTSINTFDPAKGIVGPGVTVGVYSGNGTTTPPPAKLRHYLTFTGGTATPLTVPPITATPDENFILQITRFI